MSPQKTKPPITHDLSPLECQRLLEQGAQILGLSLSDFQLEQFWNFLILLKKWNQAINLTALRSDREIIIKHFLDSLTPLPYISEDARVMDLGSGAGFPGLPIKICRPDQSVTLVEASSKKVSFLKEVLRQLNLKSIQIVQGYLGEDPLPELNSDQFDVITTRAVGKLKELLAVMSRYLSTGGQVMLMKGGHGLKEVMDLEGEIGQKGFRIEPPIHLTLPFLDQERVLILLTKT
jgi:16S rRNA (guanine527-N7)-methyltransferase